MVGFGPNNTYLLLRTNGSVISRAANTITFFEDLFGFPSLAGKSKPPTETTKHAAPSSSHPENPVARRSKRVTAKPSLFSETEFNAKVYENLFYEDLEEIQSELHGIACVVATASSIMSSEPRTFWQAMKRPDTQSWRQAITSELGYPTKQTRPGKFASSHQDDRLSDVHGYSRSSWTSSTNL